MQLMLRIYHEPWCEAQRLEAKCRAGSAQFENRRQRHPYPDNRVDGSGGAQWRMYISGCCFHAGHASWIQTDQLVWFVVALLQFWLQRISIRKKEEELHRSHLLYLVPLKPEDDLGVWLGPSFSIIKKIVIQIVRCRACVQVYSMSIRPINLSLRSASNSIC